MSLVEVVIGNGIAEVTLNRPERANTMTPELLNEAGQAFAELAEHRDLRVVVLTGGGRAFCAGGDLSRGPGGAVNGDGPLHEQSEVLRGFMRTSQLLRDMPAVTIAAINGACAGAGLSWACACDLRFAADSARFNTAFLNAGLSGDFGGTWLLPRLIGWGRASEKYLLSEPFDAAEAVDIGLVSRLWPAAKLLDEVRAVAHRLTDKAPIALRLMKQNLRQSIETSFATALDDEAYRHAYCATTADATEAAQAFLEKRTPTFTGR